MLDSFNRNINYLRVAVTNRCNHRCTYCMPPEGIPLKWHDKILSYEQIEEVVRVAASLGIRKVRLTGGEPLVRKGIEKLVAMLSPIQGIEELCMTTNGTLLPSLAGKLKTNGLQRVNISINTLNPEKYAAITRGGSLDEALHGVDAAFEYGLTPVKINMIFFADTTQSEIDSMRSFCEKKGATLQLIKHFCLSRREHNNGNSTIDRPPKCADCNRLRLTPDGYIKPCLFSNDEIRVDFSDIRSSLLSAVNAKPESGTNCKTRSMHEIGG